MTFFCVAKIIQIYKSFILYTITMYGPLQTRFYIYNQSLDKIQLESKLNFAFVCFPYKSNCLDFCY